MPFMTTVKRESFDIIAEFSRLILFWFHCDTNRYIYIYIQNTLNVWHKNNSGEVLAVIFLI